MSKITHKLIMPALFALTLAALLLWQHAERDVATAQSYARELQERYISTLQVLERARAASADIRPDGNRLAAEERRYYLRRIQRLEERIAFLETAAATIRARQRSREDDSGTLESPPSPAAMEMLLHVMGRPELREILRARISADLEQQYDTLLSFLDYDLPSESTLMALLMEKRWTDMQLSLIEMQTDLDPVLRHSAIDALQADAGDLMTALYDFMGEDDFEVFEAYEQTQPERMQVQALQRTLGQHGIPLDKEQEHALIVALHNERLDFEQFMIASWEDVENADQPPAAILEPALAAMGLQHQRTLEESAKILGADQSLIFEQSAAAHFALREIALRKALSDSAVQPR